jgi:hypothetical protein
MIDPVREVVRYRRRFRIDPHCADVDDVAQANADGVLLEA